MTEYDICRPGNYDEEPLPPAEDEGQDLLAAMLEEYEAIKDVSDPEEELASIVRYRSRLADELDRLKRNTQALLYAAEQKLLRCDQMHQERARELTKSLLKGKARSVKTAYGVAGFRSLATRLEVADQSKLPAQFLRVKTEPDKLAINAAFKDGEIVPGCEVVPPSEKFYIK